MSDTTDQVDAVTRAVSEREVDGRPAKAVTLGRVYPTGIDDLWEAVTRIDRIPSWMGPITGDLRLGGHFQIEGNASGTITACEPPRSFDATWEYGGAISWIEVRLAEVDPSNTRIELTHLAYPDEHWDQFGPGAAGVGWDLAVLGLFLHLSTDEDRPSDPADWMAGPEGVEFMVRAARAWGAADIAGGEDPDVANAAAERTVDTYTEPPAEG